MSLSLRLHYIIIIIIFVLAVLGVCTIIVSSLQLLFIVESILSASSYFVVGFPSFLSIYNRDCSSYLICFICVRFLFTHRGCQNSIASGELSIPGLLPDAVDHL